MLTAEQLAYLKANYVVQKYKKNQIVYCEGDTPTHVLCLVSGKVKIFKSGVGGRTQIVRMVKPHEMFAYRAMFAEEDFVTGASAFEPTIIYAIPKEVIKNLISQNSGLAWHFIHALSVDLGIADSRAVSLTQKHIRGRLAESLLFLRESYGVEEDGATLSIYLSREDLASLSNMTTSNAIRTLSNFVAEHIIALDGRKIKIIDEEQLKKISKIG
ncbi:MAG: Crp/Fnr family transcriptional regulator [Paludibacteraceae bacterium]|nr:Crp/Fnr family transcriptional regulator [Paludibacteraceae bacterium]